ITDRITVLRTGKLVGDYETTTLPRAQLVAKMMGRELAEFETQHQPTSRIASGSALVSAKGIGRTGSLKRVDLDISTGEIVSLAGLLGSGRTETANLIFGIEQPTTGTFNVAQASRPRCPRSAIR